MKTSDRDAILEDLAHTPFRLHCPARQTVPFIFASPHSGRAYPSSFVASSRLSLTGLRRSEDAFIEELFLPATSLGAPFLAAAFPRAYIDVNRAPGELDAAMFEQPLPFAIDTASPRVSAGLGVIPRIVREGAEIYRKKLSVAEADRRMATFYRPYHAALLRLADETAASYGVATVIDCHSMPSAVMAPDIVLGDRYGASACTALTLWAEDCFVRQGFTVARNIPYAGGYTTQIHGQPFRRRHALQIEINRALYLDEEEVVPNSGYRDLSIRLASALHRLVSFDMAALLEQPRHAAE